MGFVEVGEDAIDQFEEFERCLVVKFDHGEVLHERRTVETIDDLFDLVSVKVRSLLKHLGLVLVAVNLVV